MKQVLSLAALSCVILAGAGFAELYKATVSPEARDLYRVDYAPRDVFINYRPR
jgi:hypothetical protein